jgi:hypothetical protein
MANQREELASADQPLGFERQAQRMQRGVRNVLATQDRANETPVLVFPPVVSRCGVLDLAEP